MNYKELKGFLNTSLTEYQVEDIVKKSSLSEEDLEDFHKIKLKINWKHEEAKHNSSTNKNRWTLLQTTTYEGKTYAYNDVEGFSSLLKLGLPANFYGGNVTNVGKCDKTDSDNIFLLIEHPGKVFNIIKFDENPLINRIDGEEADLEDLEVSEITEEFIEACKKPGGIYEFEGMKVRGKENFIAELLDTGKFTE